MSAPATLHADQDRQQQQIRQAEELLFSGPRRQSIAKELSGAGWRRT